MPFYRIISDDNKLSNDNQIFTSKSILFNLHLGTYIRELILGPIIPLRKISSGIFEFIQETNYPLGPKLLISDPATVCYLIKSGADIRISYNDILFEASRSSYIDLIEHLLYEYPDLIPKLNRASKIAVRSKSYEALKILIKNGAELDYSNCYVLRKCIKRDSSMVKYLIECGADLSLEEDPGDIIEEAAETCNFPMIKFIIESNSHSEKDLRLFLNRACENGCENGCERIVEYLMTKMKPSNSSIILACRNGSLSIVKILESNGKDLKSDDSFLSIASEHNHLDLVKYLIERGISASSLDSEAFRLAAERGHLDTMIHLIESGADIASESYAAFRFASQYGHMRVLKNLVRRAVIPEEVIRDSIEGAKVFGRTRTMAYLETLLKSD